MAGLLDFLQAASNAAASNVSGPVDGINWLLKKVGVPVSDAPVGGSQWMQNKGLTRPVQQGAAQVAGETVGLLSPFMAAQYAPQIAKGLLQAGENMAAPATLNPQKGAIVWHGSPHKFDKFNVVSDSVNDMGMLGNVPTVRHGAFVSNNPKFASEYGDLTKWDIKPKKTAKITPDLKHQFVSSLDPFGPERDLWLQAKYGTNQDWGLFEGELGKRFTDWLKAEGYDSARFKEYIPKSGGGEVGGTTTVLLNPDAAKLIERIAP